MNNASRRYPFLLWALAGLTFSASGWIAGGYLGAWYPRTACAVAATAIALGLLNRQPRAALVGAAIAAIVGLAAVRFGESFVSSLLAWPIAALAIGVGGAFAFHRRRAKIALIVSAPFLGSIGFVAGMLATFLTARWLNDSRLASQLLLGGAVGFGLLLMTGAAIASRWLDATRATTATTATIEVRS